MMVNMSWLEIYKNTDVFLGYKYLLVTFNDILHVIYSSAAILKQSHH